MIRCTHSKAVLHKQHLLWLKCLKYTDEKSPRIFCPWWGIWTDLCSNLSASPQLLRFSLPIGSRLFGSKCNSTIVKPQESSHHLSSWCNWIMVSCFEETKEVLKLEMAWFKVVTKRSQRALHRAAALVINIIVFAMARSLQSLYLAYTSSITQVLGFFQNSKCCLYQRHIFALPAILSWKFQPSLMVSIVQ